MDKLTSHTTPTQIEPSEQTPQKKEKGLVAEMFETLLMAVLIFVVINTLTLRVKVINFSMRPTLDQGYYLLVNRLAYRYGVPKHGEIVIFHHNGDNTEDYIKRVIGVPGDKVVINHGEVSVNGKALYEPYRADQGNSMGEWVVPEGEYFVLGDNRNHSSDSRDWGFVKDEWLVGKALLVYWPFNQARLLTTPNQFIEAQ
ncbi:MAG: signal peptidase I [Chloroflexi bacterium]|nr:signal peptidase I [Chloroflexota bacterium]